MPVEGAVLGFSNRWYCEVLRTALVVELEPGLVLRVASAPAFLASKWAAFDERGCGTYYGSADVEDIVTVVAGCEELEQDMTGASLELRHWLGARTATFLRQDEAADVIAGALPDAWGAPTTVAEVWKRFEALVGR